MSNIELELINWGLGVVNLSHSCKGERGEQLDDRVAPQKKFLFTMESSGFEQCPWGDLRFESKSRPIFQEIMRGAGYLPGAIRELGQQTRRGLSPFIGSSINRVLVVKLFQALFILEATGVSEWIEQHIHPLSNRFVHLPEFHEMKFHITLSPDCLRWWV